MGNCNCKNGRSTQEADIITAKNVNVSYRDQETVHYNGTETRDNFMSSKAGLKNSELNGHEETTEKPEISKHSKLYSLEITKEKVTPGDEKAVNGNAESHHDNLKGSRLDNRK